MAEHNPAQTPMDKRVSWGNACVREYDKTPFAENFSLDDREIVTPLGQVSPFSSTSVSPLKPDQWNAQDLYTVVEESEGKCHTPGPMSVDITPMKITDPMRMWETPMLRPIEFESRFLDTPSKSNSFQTAPEDLTLLNQQLNELHQLRDELMNQKAGMDQLHQLASEKCQTSSEKLIEITEQYTNYQNIVSTASSPMIRFAEIQIETMKSVQPWVLTFERDNESIYKMRGSMKSEFYTDGIVLIIKDQWAQLTLVRWPEIETEDIARSLIEGQQWMLDEHVFSRASAIVDEILISVATRHFQV